MAEKRYQIFVSSTYFDLQKEREKLLFAILKLNYIPAGMELFPAMDEEQMSFIMRRIDESDYYALLLGARYGSLDKDGISYTEREYDYAVKQGKKVIALLHKNPDKVERGKTDKDEDLYNKLMAFRERVQNGGRLVAFWENTDDLISNFCTSLIQTTRLYPAIGWMRGDVSANAETIQKVAALELENQRLREYIKNIGDRQIATDIKMEACSVTNPTVFSETEIECVSLQIIPTTNGSLDERLFIPRYSFHSCDEIFKFYTKKAMPWFIQMARTCRIDLRIKNPNSFMIKNMSSENHFFDLDGNEIPHSIEDDRIENCPYNNDLEENSSMTRQIKPEINLNPQQSTMYTHHRYFIPENDYDMIYQRIIFAENIIEPIKKVIKVHFRIKKQEVEVNSLIRTIQELEKKKKFNDAGVYEYVMAVLTGEQEEQNECNTK